VTRAALGALGAWWALLAAPLLGRETLGGVDTFVLPATAQRALDDVLVPLITSGALLYAAVWALAALLLPWLVRGRWLALDIVAACAWAGALGASTAATAGFIGAPEPRGVVLGAAIAGLLAVGVPHLRGGRVVEP
jgi:hypothetical protein